MPFICHICITLTVSPIFMAIFTVGFHESDGTVRIPTTRFNIQDGHGAFAGSPIHRRNSATDVRHVQPVHECCWITDSHRVASTDQRRVSHHGYPAATRNDPHGVLKYGRREDGPSGQTRGMCSHPTTTTTSSCVTIVTVNCLILRQLLLCIIGKTNSPRHPS